MIFHDAVFLLIACTSITFIISSLYFQVVTICKYTDSPPFKTAFLTLASLIFHLLLIRSLLWLISQKADIEILALALFSLATSGFVMSVTYNTYKKFSE